MSTRRAFMALLGGAAAAWPLAARAQQGERMRRIGVLMGVASHLEAQDRLVAFRQALERLGWDRECQYPIRLPLGSEGP